MLIGTNQGHIWLLCTNAVGDIYYQNSNKLAEMISEAKKKSEFTELHAFLDSDRIDAYIELLSIDQPKNFKKLKSLKHAYDYVDNSKLLEIATLIRDSMFTQGDSQMVILFEFQIWIFWFICFHSVEGTSMVSCKFLYKQNVRAIM